MSMKEAKACSDCLPVTYVLLMETWNGKQKTADGPNIFTCSSLPTTLQSYSPSPNRTLCTQINIIIHTISWYYLFQINCQVLNHKVQYKISSKNKKKHELKLIIVWYWSFDIDNYNIQTRKIRDIFSSIAYREKNCTTQKIIDSIAMIYVS
jgi:hypothetical protein